MEYNLYSVPYSLIGHELDVRLTGNTVEVFNRGQPVAIHRGDGSYPKMLNRLSRIRLLVLDDWGTAPLGPSESRDILEIVDDRSQLSSTIIAGQLPVEDWHASIIDPSVADPVLDGDSLLLSPLQLQAQCKVDPFVKTLLVGFLSNVLSTR